MIQKKLKLMTMIIGIIFFSVLSSIQPVSANDNGDYDSFEQIIQKHMDRYDIPGVAIGIIRENEIVFQDAFGYANSEDQIPITESTLLRAESISKTITAYLVLILVENEFLSLETPVRDYIDIDIPETITLHTLLTHTAGLEIGPFSEHYQPLDPDIPSVQQHLLDTISFYDDPPTSFQYSNVGYNLIQYVIESVMNQSFNDVVLEYILDPLAIDDASFVFDSNNTNRYALGYDIHSQPVEPYIYPEQSSGGLFTDIEALTYLVKNMITNESILSDANQSLLYTKHVNVKGEYQLVSDGYSYGHFIEEHNPLGVFHGGQGHGFMAFFYANPTEDSAIVILTNSQRSYPMMSELVHEYTKTFDLPVPGFSMIATSIPYISILVGVVILLALVRVSILAKRYLNQKPIIRHTIIEPIMITLMIGLILYLWMSPYFFLQVLYPLHVEYVRMTLSIYCFIEVLFYIVHSTTTRHKKTAHS